jgi:predicted TIM-barrel fold metal-dependent hydrolase
MLIDVHSHFYTEESGRPDWLRLNERRLAVASRIGITAQVASILGTWGRRSPTYFPSPDDVRHANHAMAALCRAHPRAVYGYCVVNPNDTDGALGEIERAGAEGMIGLKLAASRRADDRLVDSVVEAATRRGWPILHHVWQHRRREWPGQEASDARELACLADRHPDGHFILAHLGGGGDWSHSLRVMRSVENVWVDLSGSGVDIDMVHAALDEVGPARLVWGTDLTIDTAVARLRYLDALGLSDHDRDGIRWRNAWDLFVGMAHHVGH